jgi:polar amino acid transport system substrate-binding protein
MFSNKMKILYLLAIAAILLAACAPAPAAPAATQPPAAPTATSRIPDATAAIQPGVCLGSAAQAIVDLNCKEITIAVENAYPPFNYIVLSTGQPGGWDYDAWNEICTRLHCTPKYVEASWEGMIQAVADGQYDAAADGITITDDRKQKVDFSMGYVKVDQRLLTRKGETRFASMDDFVKNDKLIMGTQTGTTNYETAAKFLPESRIKAFEQFPFAVQALISGDIDAVIMDETAGQGYLGENSDKVQLVGPSISGDELGFIFPKGSSLVDPVNKAIQAMNADGTLNKFNEKYFGVNFKSIESDIKQ